MLKINFGELLETGEHNGSKKIIFMMDLLCGLE